MGVFEGTDCGENLFCPIDPVDGATFAVWLARVLGESVEGASDAVARLVELGAAIPCSGQPAGLCPTEEVSRAKLATFVSRALDLPASEPIGFWDVGRDNEHFDSINRLAQSELDVGCSPIRFVPFDYCPDRLVTRGEMAELLVEIIEYIEVRGVVRIDPGSKPDNSINLAVDYVLIDDTQTETATASWRNPPGSSSRVDHYVLQWRPSWSDFDYRRYRVIEFDSDKSEYEVEFSYEYLPDYVEWSRRNIPGFEFTPSERLVGEQAGNMYAVRVIVVYADTSRSATDPVKVPNPQHRFRELDG